MSARWSWFFGVATLGALAISIVVLVTIPGGSVLSFVLGCIVGATGTGMSVALMLRPKGAPVSAVPASIASAHSAGSLKHGSRLKSYRQIPNGHLFRWTATGAKAGMAKPRGEKFDVFDTDDLLLGEVSTLDEAARLIEAAVDGPRSTPA